MRIDGQGPPARIERRQAARSGARTGTRRWDHSLSLVQEVAGRDWDESSGLLLLADGEQVSDGVPDPAVVFLRQRGRQRHWPDKTDEELSALVDDSFLGADPLEVVRLADQEHTSDRAALDAAVNFVHEWRVHTWTLGQNRKGIAPPTATVLAQFETQRLPAPDGLRPRARGSSDRGHSGSAPKAKAKAKGKGGAGA